MVSEVEHLISFVYRAVHPPVFLMFICAFASVSTTSSLQIFVVESLKGVI